MSTAQTVDQILRVLHPGCVPALEHMLEHEINHFKTFDGLLTARKVRPCHALPLWMVGGWMLGTITALFGERVKGATSFAIWLSTKL